jgi:hypothetical protein
MDFPRRERQSDTFKKAIKIPDQANKLGSPVEHFSNLRT